MGAKSAQERPKGVPRAILGSILEPPGSILKPLALDFGGLGVDFGGF